MLLDKKIPLKYVFEKIKFDIALIFIFVFLVISAEKFLTIDLKLPPAIPAFLGTAISLVLAFKLVQSYERWWEARKIWGSIVNDSRTLVVQAKSFCKRDDNNNEDELIKKIGLRQIAWCYALSASLRKVKPVKNLQLLLEKEECDVLSKHSNVPLKLIDFNADDIRTLHSKGVINDFQQIQMDNTLVRLCGSMGKAERIKSTVFPKTYRMFLRFFIYVFILALAISLSDLQPAYELILLVSISLPFLLLKRTAHHMQDPFDNKPTDTAMNAISRTIEINIKQLLNLSDVPKATDLKGSYFVM